MVFLLAVELQTSHNTCIPQEGHALLQHFLQDRCNNGHWSTALVTTAQLRKLVTFEIHTNTYM